METSHLSPKEAFAMVREGKAQGLKKMVATHCNQWATPYTIEEQKAMLESGAVISYCYEAYLAKTGVAPDPISNLTKLIHAIGADNVVLGSDMGSDKWPSGIEGMKMMIGGLIDEGFSDDDIARMVQINPDRIYGLSAHAQKS
jgi:microsomal dipeptidase-like Zn-dependent dipeptidase